MPVASDDATHLLRRTGFGVRAELLAEVEGAADRAAAVDRLLAASDEQDATSAIPPVVGSGFGEDTFWSWITATEWWLERMRTSPSPLVEKLTLFWHGHFACSMDKVADMSLLAAQNATLRTHALGDYHDLHQAMAVDPAMLRYLDNAWNTRHGPQENFARELMELFTLGVGHHTQDDVVAMARAWTGHSLDPSLRRYQYHDHLHDHGPASLFGSAPRHRSGPEALTELLTGRRSTVAARFITAELVSFLAMPVGVTEPLVVDLAERFVVGGLQLRPLVRDILTSTLFWSDAARRALVRSPVEWAVAALQATSTPAPGSGAIWMLAEAGHVPFMPPNVAGWKQNGYWISTAGAWARQSWAVRLCHDAAGRGALDDLSGTSAADAVATGFDRFGVSAPTDRTRQVLESWFAGAVGERSTVAPTLALLLALSPEFQLA